MATAGDEGRAQSGGLRGWLAERIPVDAGQLRELTNEPVPHHLKRWWFCLGGTPAYLFVVQIVTGVLLALYYQDSPDSAYQSVQYITDQVAYGWYFRGLHKWGATFMVAAVILHQMRVYFTAAYRRPRELNWVVGMCLLISTLMIGFTGYSLVFEQLSYWGATVGANICDSVPVVGHTAKLLLLGGEAYNPRTLSRLYLLHTALIPGTIVLLLIVHIAFIRIHGVTELDFGDAPVPEEKRYFNFFPDHMLTELIVGLVLMILLSVMATLFPPELGARANPLVTPEEIKPEWFFYATYRWLKMFSAGTAVLSICFIVAAMFVWPWIDGLLTRVTGSKDTSIYIGIVATLALIGLTVFEASVAH